MTDAVRPYLVAAAWSSVCGLCLLAHVSIGSFEASLGQVLGYLVRPDDSAAAFAVRELRLPRAVVALLVGASLAISGAIIQAIMRNPLGDPGLTGVTAGASCGVALVLSYVTVAQGALIGAGILGGAGAAFLTFLLARRSGFEPVQLILSGVAVSILFLALTSAVMIINRATTQTLYFWLIGGFVNRTWMDAAYLWPWVASGALLALLAAPILNVLAFDDTVARSLGARTALWRLVLGLISVVLAAAPVAVAGPISFVGFLAPHLARVMLGRRAARNGHLLPFSALIGASLTLLADTASRGLPIDRPPPAGVFVAVVGGVMFLLLSRRLIGRVG